MKGTMSDDAKTDAVPAATPAAAPVDLNKVRAEARAKAQTDERVRCAAIRLLATPEIPGLQAVLDKAIDDGTDIGEAQALAMGHIQANIGKVGHTQSREADEAGTPSVPAAQQPAPGPARMVEEDETMDLEAATAKAEALWKCPKRGKAIREEFGDKGTLAHYMLAEATNLISVFGGGNQSQRPGAVSGDLYTTDTPIPKV